MLDYAFDADKSCPRVVATYYKQDLYMANQRAVWTQTIGILLINVLYPHHTMYQFVLLSPITFHNCMLHSTLCPAIITPQLPTLLGPLTGQHTGILILALFLHLFFFLH